MEHFTRLISLAANKTEFWLHVRDSGDGHVALHYTLCCGYDDNIRQLFVWARIDYSEFECTVTPIVKPSAIEG